MASFALTAGQRAAHDKALTASTVDTVTFTDPFREVLVRNVTGTNALYFTIDGTAPTVSGATTFKVPAAAGATRVVSVPNLAAALTVKVISSGAMTYDVEGVGNVNLS